MGAAGGSPTVYHWHGDTFFPPEGATLLGSSQACERQAYRVSEKVYGFQFHPEAAAGPHDAQSLFDRFVALIADPRQGVPPASPGPIGRLEA